MTGVKADRRLRRIEHPAELLFDFRSGALEMWRQPGLDPLTQPKQALAELRQPCAPALLLRYQRLPDEARPFGDQAPGLPVGQADPRRRACQLSRLPDRLEQGE